MTADSGVVFVNAVVVDEHRRRPNIGFLANRRIPHIGEVWDFRPTPNLCIFRFHKTAEFAVFAQNGSWAQIGERSNSGTCADL